MNLSSQAGKRRPDGDRRGATKAKLLPEQPYAVSAAALFQGDEEAHRASLRCCATVDFGLLESGGLTCTKTDITVHRRSDQPSESWMVRK